MAIIRKAALRDVPALLSMINNYADLRLLLPRTFEDVCENIREFTVAEEDGKVVACGALKPYDRDIAEIRSLCVAPGRKSSGHGRAITERLLSQARRRKLKNVFALTVAPDFFQKCGFREAPRENFPMKIWRDCVHCPKLFCCDEKTMVFDLVPREASASINHSDAEKVTA